MLLFLCCSTVCSISFYPCLHYAPRRLRRWSGVRHYAKNYSTNCHLPSQHIWNTLDVILGIHLSHLRFHKNPTLRSKLVAMFVLQKLHAVLHNYVLMSFINNSPRLSLNRTISHMFNIIWLITWPNNCIFL